MAFCLSLLPDLSEMLRTASPFLIVDRHSRATAFRNETGQAIPQGHVAACCRTCLRKASFESFMKQVTGIGDSTGEFVMPDGSKADMSKAAWISKTAQSLLSFMF